MEIVKCLSELIDEELDDACKYVDLAMKWKQREKEQKTRKLQARKARKKMEMRERYRRIFPEKWLLHPADPGILSLRSTRTIRIMSLTGTTGA